MYNQLFAHSALGFWLAAEAGRFQPLIFSEWNILMSNCKAGVDTHLIFMRMPVPLLCVRQALEYL